MAGLIKREVGENNTFTHNVKIMGFETFGKNTFRKYRESKHQIVLNKIDWYLIGPFVKIISIEIATQTCK